MSTITDDESLSALLEATNFRDLGGLEASSNARVVPGRLFRSGYLGRDSDIVTAVLRRLGVGEIHDLRLPEEIRVYPSIQTPGVRIHTYGLEVIDLETVFEAATGHRPGFLPADTVATVIAGYASAPRRLTFTLRRLLQTLAVQTDNGALVHCMTGKDRTGIAIAVILAAIGVPAEAIAADYLRSHAAIKPAREAAALARYLERQRKCEVDIGLLHPLFETRTEYISAALDTLLREYGSFEGYLQEGLGLEPEVRQALACRFLE